MTPYEFLSIVWRGKVGYGFLCFKDKSSWEGIKHWKEYPVKLPLGEASIEEAMGHFPPSGYDWYFSPCTFSEPKRQVRYAQDTDLLWADVDEGNVNLLGKLPYLHWATSAGRSSALWKQDRVVPASVAEAANAYIAKTIKADPSGRDVTQVLRVVGTYNHKPNKGNEVTLISSSPIAHDFREETLRGMFILYQVSQRIISLLGDDVGADDDRSSRLFAINHELYKAGFDTGKVVELLRYSKWNKFGDDIHRLKEDVERTWRKFNTQAASEIRQEEEMEGLEAFDLCSIESEDLSFLWDPYIPEGKITIIEGDPGLGKSWLTMKLAADLSCGRPLPGSDPLPPHKILLLSAEDGLSDTIKPRLEIMEANFKNIYAVNQPVYITDHDMKRIRAICIEHNISVIIIDPLVAFMGGKIDLHKANQTRDIMARLARLGDELGVTIICIRHLTKGGKDKAIYRGLGSIDITGAARSVLAIGRDPSNPYSGRVMCHIKSNLAREGLSLLYYLDDNDEPFRWGEFTDDRAQDILAVDVHGHGKPKTKRSEADEQAEDLTRGMEEVSPRRDRYRRKEEEKYSELRLKYNRSNPWELSKTNPGPSYDQWARKIRRVIREGGGQKQIEDALYGAPENVKELIRQKYYNL